MLEFRAPVTFLAGDDGSGKSTLLDEPETPLSPARILALMAMIAGAVAAGCQFIIASHSPILMIQGEEVVETVG